MNLKFFNPDYLLSLCQKYGLRPSKKYGQNFLLAPEIIESMVAAAEVSKKDTVVEVGPGFGVLTFALAEKAGKVLAFEIEKKLKPYWDTICHPRENGDLDKQRLDSRLRGNDSWGRGNDSNIEIIWGNVLKNFEGQKLEEYKVVANLPYQITSNVIRAFLESKNPPSVMVLMVQKEVAERICAKPGKMSLLSVAVQYYADAEIVAQAPRHFFWPEPAVDSTVIKMTPYCHSDPDVTSGEESLKSRKGILPTRGGQALAQDDNCVQDDSKKCVCDDKFKQDFFKVVKAGFAQKRKKLVKNLPQIEPFLKELGIGEQARAQELSLRQWKELVIHLSA